MKVYLAALILGVFVPVGSAILVRYGLEYVSPSYPPDASWGIGLGIIVAAMAVAAIAFVVVLIKGRRLSHPPVPYGLGLLGICISCLALILLCI